MLFLSHFIFAFAINMNLIYLFIYLFIWQGLGSFAMLGLELKASSFVGRLFTT
jgi:hypothetical protein